MSVLQWHVWGSQVSYHCFAEVCTCKEIASQSDVAGAWHGMGSVPRTFLTRAPCALPCTTAHLYCIASVG